MYHDYLADKNRIALSPREPQQAREKTSESTSIGRMQDPSETTELIQLGKNGCQCSNDGTKQALCKKLTKGSYWLDAFQKIYHDYLVDKNRIALSPREPQQTREKTSESTSIGRMQDPSETTELIQLGKNGCHNRKHLGEESAGMENLPIVYLRMIWGGTHK